MKEKMKSVLGLSLFFAATLSTSMPANAKQYHANQYAKELPEWERTMLAEEGIPPKLANPIIREYAEPFIEYNASGQPRIARWASFSVNDFITMYKNNRTPTDIAQCVEGGLQVKEKGNSGVSFYSKYGLAEYCMLGGDISLAVALAPLFDRVQATPRERADHLYHMQWSERIAGKAKNISTLDPEYLKILIAWYQKDHEISHLSWKDLYTILDIAASVPKRYLLEFFGSDSTIPDIRLDDLNVFSIADRYFTPPVYIRSLLDVGLNISGNKGLGLMLVAELYRDGVSPQKAADLFLPKKEQTFNRFIIGYETLDDIIYRGYDDRVLDSLENVPDALQRIVIHAGAHLVFTRRPINELPNYKDLYYIGGVYNYQSKRMLVIIRDYDYEIPRTIHSALHEFGHAADDLVGFALYGMQFSEREDFMPISATCLSLSPEEPTPKQIFAEGFSQYYMSAGWRYTLYKSCPGFVPFMQDIESDIQNFK